MIVFFSIPITFIINGNDKHLKSREDTKNVRKNVRISHILHIL